MIGGFAAAGRNAPRASFEHQEEHRTWRREMATMAQHLPRVTARRVGGTAPTVFHGFKVGITGSPRARLLTIVK